MAVSIFVIHLLGDAAAPWIVGSGSDRVRLANAALMLIALATAASGILWAAARSSRRERSCSASAARSILQTAIRRQVSCPRSERNERSHCMAPIVHGGPAMATNRQITSPVIVRAPPFPAAAGATEAQVVPTGSRRVLVLGEDTCSFLSVVRSLGRYGLEVHAAGSAQDSPALSSRYVAAFHRLPQYVLGDSSWLDAVTALMRRFEFELVIPCHDADILPLQAHRDRIEPHGAVYLLDTEAFEATIDKFRTVQLATQVGVAVPASRLVRSLPELREAGRDLGFPLVLKPRSSFGLDALHQRRTVQIVRSPEALERVEWQDEQTLLAQEYFGGRGVGVDALCHEGRILVALQHQRLHEPPQGGGSSYRRTVALEPQLLQAAERLLSAIRYTGVGMVEFRVDPDSGAWKLMEINARFWGSLPLSIAAGADYPRYLYELLCRGRRQFPREYRLNVYARNWLADYYWFQKDLKADRSDPYLLTVPRARVVKEFSNLLLGREASDTLALDDPHPAVTELRNFLRSGLVPRLRKAGPLRRVVAARARHASAVARNLLFVCKGNICRSPFAAGLVNQRGHARGLVARSAGSIPLVGRSAPQAAQQAAARFGVDLSCHRSKVLAPELAEWADIVFIFDREHEAAIRALAPELLTRTHYLGALDRRGPLEIADPYGEDEHRFDETYSRIAALLDPLCQRATSIGTPRSSARDSRAGTSA